MVDTIALLKPRNLKYLASGLQALVKGRLWLKVIIGMILGVVFGIAFNPAANIVDEETAFLIGEWVVLPGNFFLTMVQMIVVPLVFASVIRGIAANTSIKQLKSTGLKLVIYFLATTFIAVLIGVTIATIIRPGIYVDIAPTEGGEVAEEVQENIGEEEAVGLRNIPSAIIDALPNNPISDAAEANMLQVVLFSVIVGLALIQMKAEQSRPLLDLLGSILTVSMTVVRWVMVLAPFAVFGLIAQLVLQTGFEVFVGIGAFVATVLFGLAILMSMYLAIAYIAGGWAPWTFLAHIREAQLLAFSTDSSAATMPLSLKVVEEKLKVRPSISQFVIPLGTTVNMNATALFQGLATIFFTQVYGLDLGMGVLIVLIVTIIGSSIGTPATPGVGVVVLAVVLSGAGIPIEGIALIIGIDQILERFRASLNVTGDLVASVVMDRLTPLAEPSYEEEIVQQHELEAHRRSTGEDVVVHNS